MKFSANDIEGWAQEYADAPDVKHLVGLIEADRNLPQPGNLIPGSPERQLAQSRQDRLLQLATKLGYKPPVKELASTLVKEVIKSELLGATGLAETPVGHLAEKLPVPERASKAEREQEDRDNEKKRRKQHESGFGLSLNKTP